LNSVATLKKSKTHKKGNDAKTSLPLFSSAKKQEPNKALPST
jgi:hypothetical protein